MIADVYSRSLVLHELGRTTRLFTEIAGRVEPNVGDVTLALADMGIKIDPVSLRTFMRRHGRIVIPNPQGLPLTKNPVILSVGKRRSLPHYIPDYFPPMPDPHTYIRTPVSSIHNRNYLSIYTSINSVIDCYYCFVCRLIVNR